MPKKNPMPGEPKYDWVADYGTDDLYTHTFTDGTVVALRTVAAVATKSWLYQVREMKNDFDVQFAAIDRAASDTAKAVIKPDWQIAAYPELNEWLRYEVAAADTTPATEEAPAQGHKKPKKKVEPC
jgi:hypothetical protein